MEGEKKCSGIGTEEGLIIGNAVMAVHQGERL